jgi:two-component system sensor histidine kinase DesK
VDRDSEDFPSAAAIRSVGVVETHATPGPQPTARLDERLGQVAQALSWSGARDTAGPSDDRMLPSGPMATRLRALVWLGFLAFPFEATITEAHTPGLHKAVVVGAGVLFAAIYTGVVLGGAWELPRRSVEAAVVVLLILATFATIYDSQGWAYLFIYTVFPALRIFGVRLSTVAGVAALAAAVGGIAGLPAGTELAVPLIVLGAGTSMFGVYQLVEANQKLRRAEADEARLAVEAERLRFARDLHDLLGHSLSVITLKSEVAGRLLGTDLDRAATEVAEIEQTARRALREVREAVSGYRRASLLIEVAGARTALAAAGITWHEQLPDVELPPAVEAVVAWTVREGVTNVVRHSRATSCTLSVHVDATTVQTTVADDGRGVPAAKTTAGLTPGFGLVGLGERVKQLGGELVAGPGPGGGFELRASVPVAPPRAGADGSGTDG